jgi:hypothetical protein
VEEFEIIPREQWQRFCADFSRKYRGWLVRLWVLDTVNLEAGSDENASMAVRDLALWEIATERHGDRIDLVVMTRDDEAESHVDHPVRDVDALMVERDEEGVENGLLINSTDAKSTLIRFRVPAAPETLDGLGPGETS